MYQNCARQRGQQHPHDNFSRQRSMQRVEPRTTYQWNSGRKTHQQQHQQQPRGNVHCPQRPGEQSLGFTNDGRLINHKRLFD